mgnify:CR=1 FL=1
MERYVSVPDPPGFRPDDVFGVDREYYVDPAPIADARNSPLIRA